MDITLQGLGLIRRCEGKEREEIRKHNKKLWEKWKEENGFDHNTPLRDIPGFLDSIERMHLSGYGFTDIGLDYGRSHQRISKIWIKYGLRRNPYGVETMLRDWSDAGNRFIAVPTEVKISQITERIRHDAEETKSIRLEHAQEADIETIIELVKGGNGRQPTLQEITERRGYTHYRGVGAHWNYNFNRMFEAANVRRVETRGRGPKRIRKNQERKRINSS